MKTIGERIKWLRKERLDYTQEFVGNYVGVGKATIQKYENGVITNIPSDRIMLLAEILDTTPDFIMGFTENPDRDAKKQPSNPQETGILGGKDGQENVVLPKTQETRIVSAWMDDLPQDDREIIVSVLMSMLKKRYPEKFRKEDET